MENFNKFIQSWPMPKFPDESRKCFHDIPIAMHFTEVSKWLAENNGNIPELLGLGSALHSKYCALEIQLKSTEKLLREYVPLALDTLMEIENLCSGEKSSNESVMEGKQSLLSKQIVQTGFFEVDLDIILDEMPVMRLDSKLYLECQSYNAVLPLLRKKITQHMIELKTVIYDIDYLTDEKSANALMMERLHWEKRIAERRARAMISAPNDSRASEYSSDECLPKKCSSCDNPDSESSSIDRPALSAIDPNIHKKLL